jgi:hypothetical protein
MHHVWLVLWLARVPLLAAEADAILPAPPPLAACVSSETSSYRISMGILGTIAELTLQIVPESLPSAHATLFPSSLRAVAQGGGSVFGMGKTDQRIESELDARQLTTRRWKNVRSNGHGVTTDTGEQPQPGTVALLRKRSNEADRAESFTRTQPIFDPVGFLLHLRVALPTKPTTYEVLDGRALWLVLASPARVGPDTQDMWRVDGKLEPIFWDGKPDGERARYAFSMFFTRDRFHSLTKVVAPLGLGEIKVDLVRLDRSTPMDFGRAFYCSRLRRPGVWGVLAAFAEAKARSGLQTRQ